MVKIKNIYTNNRFRIYYDNYYLKMNNINLLKLWNLWKLPKDTYNIEGGKVIKKNNFSWLNRVNVKNVKLQVNSVDKQYIEL